MLALKWLYNRKDVKEQSSKPELDCSPAAWLKLLLAYLGSSWVTPLNSSFGITAEW